MCMAAEKLRAETAGDVLHLQTSWRIKFYFYSQAILLEFSISGISLRKKTMAGGSSDLPRALPGINSCMELLHSPRQIVSSVCICLFLVVLQQKKALQISSKNDNTVVVRVTLTSADWSFKINYQSADSWQAQAGRSLS